MARSQEILDNLIAIDDTSQGNDKTRYTLEKTQDRAVLGAGVAGAMAAINLPWKKNFLWHFLSYMYVKNDIHIFPSPIVATYINY